MNQEVRAVVMGASAGGVEAVCFVLSKLKSDCRVPIIVVLHLPPVRDTRLTQILRSKSSLPVLEAEDKQPLEGGRVLTAPPDYHLLVENEESLALSSDLPVHHSRPSIDVLFESAADVFGPAVIGIVLTGANRDGAAGLAKITAGGGIGIVQAPEEAFCRTMPDAAIEQSGSAIVLDVMDIPLFLNARI